ncbi:FAD-binding oxidoreductase [Paracoccus laeviglucosivorans]|uniref:FAD/FMN-containing dehydrogenase n=1 Tax=Paracoccus laeviglucosivorans TaxID=1197861 RepID=A0A521FNM3_9RHOB|nr:FAD-binding oxidoreductase [Paracoccus laeviglucosivorans]SMO97739.1 FAD/FMN-containing dehydrogenase [Paracoccus laeviglucosivorans]
MTMAIDALTTLLGAAGLITNPADLSRYAADASVQGPDMPLAVLRPKTTDEASKAVAICAQAGIPMVPQGGRTGLSGGAVPPAGAVVISTERMSGVIAVNTQAMTLTAWAGTPLQVVQEAARAQGLDYPVDIGARGSATIGGTVATNAGGIRVLRHGMTRRHVLGLEIVLPDGAVLSRMRGLVKDNAGYDLCQPFIGSEGTLGLITQVMVQLCPDEPFSALALLSLRDHAAALDCLVAARSRFGDRLSAFEGMWPDYLDAVCTTWSLVPAPFATPGFAVLLELRARADAQLDGFQDWLGELMEAGLVDDGIVARSHDEERRLWALREAVGEVDAQLGPHISFDLSVAVDQLGQFCHACDRKLRGVQAAGQVIKVGHLGDGNVHILVAHDGSDASVTAISRSVYCVLREYNGSVTAEHGVGRSKRDWLTACRDPVEMIALRRQKQIWDPKSLMNPHSILDLRASNTATLIRQPHRSA